MYSRGRQISVSDIRVVGGNLLLTEQTPNTFISDVARLVIHPGYNRRTNADDIAILIVCNCFWRSILCECGDEVSF